MSQKVNQETTCLRATAVFRMLRPNTPEPAVDKALLDLLYCPETREKLSLAPPALVEKLNAGIEAGTLKTRAGAPVKDRLDAALVRPDGKFAYGVVDDIPNLILDEAIPLEAT